MLKLHLNIGVLRTGRLLGGLVIGVLFNAVLPGGALAYSLSDHEQITLSALLEVERCLQGDISEELKSRVIRSNLWEDKNILNKWIRFSHFYHPDHPELGSLRENSRARVAQLEDELVKLGKDPAQLSKRLKLLGYLIHHLQDMTVPLHVLPVNHFWTDGFEKLKVPVQPSEEPCDSLIQQSLRSTPLEIHQQTAWETLETFRRGELTATLPWNQKVPLSWFWEEGSNDEFGGYGVLGNSFGMSWLSLPGQQFRIEPREYAEFKAARLTAAERVTRQILMRYWLLGALDAAR